MRRHIISSSDYNRQRIIYDAALCLLAASLNEKYPGYFADIGTFDIHYCFYFRTHACEMLLETSMKVPDLGCR